MGEYRNLLVSTYCGGRGKKDKADDRDLSDGVEWYEEGSCEATTCKRPKGKRTAWVRREKTWFVHTLGVGGKKDIKVDGRDLSDWVK